MNRKVQPAFVLLVLALLATTCGGEAPTVTPVQVLALGDEAFRNEATGYSILYPLGWHHISKRQLGADFFYAPGEPIEQIMKGDVMPTVPLVVIAGGTLGSILEGGFDHAQDARGMLDEVVAGVNESEDFSEGKIQELSVANQVALAADVGWSEKGVEVAGRFVTIHMGDRGFVIQAVGTVAGWEAFVPTFEAMLASMTIFEPVPQILLSEDYLGDGYFISFPAGWRVYIVEGVSIFAAKQEFLEEEVPSVPVMLIESGALDTLSSGKLAEAQDAREMLGVIVEVYRAKDKNIEFDEIQDVTISDRRGASISMHWDEDGTPAFQLITAIHQGNWGLLIQTVGTVEGWQTFIPVYEEIIKALVILFEPEP